MKEKIYTHLKESGKFERPLDIEAALGLESTGIVCFYLCELFHDGRIEFPRVYSLGTETSPSLTVRAITRERRIYPHHQKLIGT